MSETHLHDRRGRQYEPDGSRWRGDDGSVLSYPARTGFARTDIDEATQSLWRYRNALGVPLRTVVTAGEGRTPLVPLRWEDAAVHAKLECLNPTGSFKDRGTSVMISALASAGVDHLIEDSSGNGGASVACYAAVAGLHCTVVVSDKTSPGKLSQIRAYGAEVLAVAGDRAYACEVAQAMHGAEHSYVGHNWHPAFPEGIKTIGYEVWEDLGFRAPDNIVVVAGAGSLVLGCAQAFDELHASRLVDRVPRIFAAQPANCSPLAAAFAAGLEQVEEPSDSNRPWSATIAEGASITKPVRDREVLTAVSASGGAFVTVTESEIRSAWLRLARAGHYVEPTSAVAAAGLDRFRGTGQITDTDLTILVLTGNGLKTGAP